MVLRRTPWFVCLSAFRQPVTRSRWGQDKQNLVSVFHDRTGLIVGGGNTKLQPLWSSFSIGDYLRWKPVIPADGEPDFAAPAGVVHVPSEGRLVPERAALELSYGGRQCRVQVNTANAWETRLIYEVPDAGSERAEAHVTLVPHLGEKWQTASGKSGTLSEQPFRLAPGEAGAWLAHHGWRISLPKEAAVIWPALPFNPYRKDGAAKADEGLIVIVLPFGEAARRHELAIELAER
jgi:hypothetical protein